MSSNRALPLTAEDSEALALRALGWLLTDDARAERLFAFTGLDCSSLRDRLEDPAVLTGLLCFLEAYEPDLIAAAGALEVEPQSLVTARQVLDGSAARLTHAQLED